MMFIKNPSQLYVGKLKKGFTLTEIAIVLGIMGLILGAIWAAAAGVYSNQRANTTNKQIITVMQSVRTMYATMGTTAGLTAANLIAANAVPADMVKAGALVNPYSGAVTVFPTTNNTGFYITVSNLRRADCVKLLTSVAGQSRDASMFLATAATTIPAAGALGTPLTVVATPALADSAAPANNFGGCSVANLGLTATFGFGLH